MVEHFFIYNDKFYAEDTPVISSGNRSLRYGDGLFETIKMINGRIINKEFHFERLLNGLRLLHFDLPKIMNPFFFEEKIKALADKNDHRGNVRIRIMLFRGNGGIFDPVNNIPSYIIESWKLADELELNQNGLVVDIYPEARKSCDSFSNLKSNNYLPYVMAAFFAKKNKLNDCIILNALERICDSAIANVFIIKDEKIFTPPLTEGCVAGVMRRWLLEKAGMGKYVIIQKELSIDDLLAADEFFLTNSIYYLRWVKSFREKTYSNSITREIFNHVIQTI
jgi:branched-chain amino acid aminotransferase